MLIEFRVAEQNVPVLAGQDGARIRPPLVVRPVEVVGQEDVQSYPEPGGVVPQDDPVEDVVVLAQPQQLRPVGQRERDLADELSLLISEYRRERLAGRRVSTASISCQSSECSGPTIASISTGAYSPARSGFALDFHSRHTGTMSGYCAHELVPVTTSSAGQPPRQSDTLQAPHALCTRGLVNKSNSFARRLRTTWPFCIWAKNSVVSKG